MCAQIWILPLKLSTTYFLVNDKTQGLHKNFELMGSTFFHNPF